MAQSESKWNPDNIEITHKLELTASAWDVSAPDVINSEPLVFGNLTAKVKCYPKFDNHFKGSKQYGSLYIELCSDVDSLGKDNRQFTITATCGSVIRTGSVMVRNFASNQSMRVKGFQSIDYLKQNPIIYVTLKINYNPQIILPKAKQTFSFQQQHQLLYTLSKSDGDITLIVDLDNNSQPPLKKRRLNDDDDTDITVSNRIKVSGIVLSCASPVFRNMLSIDMIEKEEKVITVYAKSMKDVDDMIYFMCTNQLRKDANALHLLELANYYQMERLKYECINGMITNICMDTFVDTVNLFDRYAIKEGYNVFFQFAKEHIDELKKEKMFDELSHAFTMAVTQLR